MGDPLTLGLGVIGGGLSAYGSAMAGREQSRAAQFEQDQLRVQAQIAQTQAAQAEAKRREELTASLETIQALRAGRGVGLSSPTGDAIIGNVTEDQERDIRRERLNYLMASDRARMGAEMAGDRGKTSLLGGYLGAGAELLKTGARGYSFGKTKGWWG